MTILDDEESHKMNLSQLQRPEELSDAELIKILTFLNVTVSFDDPRSHLLDVFKRVALPLPQRQAKITNRSANPTSSKRNFDEPDFKSLKRDQVSITQVVHNTKKMKLTDSQPPDFFPQCINECNDECILHEDTDVNFKREFLKRKLCTSFPSTTKRMKLLSQF